MIEFLWFVITACAVILAIEPAIRFLRSFRNWRDRRQAHKRSIQ
jgi:hypothetical protein